MRAGIGRAATGAPRDVRWSLALFAVLLSVIVANSIGPLAAIPRQLTPLHPEPGPWGHTASSTIAAAAPPPAGMAVDFLSYPSSANVEEFCHQLAAAYPDLVRVTEIGRSYQGRPILCIRLAGGDGDPDSRPALQMDGQHHAREPIGQLAVLYTAWHLVSGYGTDPLATHLLDTRTVYAVPMVNPDGNEIFLNQYWGQRKNARPTDEDGDGQLDEDPPDGVSGVSVFQVVEVQFRASWLARHPGNPFVPGWQWGASRRTTLGFLDETAGKLIPQLDNDGDGKTNEDPPGGVDLNRNYPAGWDNCSDQPATQIYRRTAPWSESETKAIRDLYEAHPNIRLGISYHSGDDRLAVPGIPGDQMTADEALLELIGIKASELTEACGYTGTRHQHGSPRADGETRAWLYELGVIPWLVEAYVWTDVVKWSWADREEGRAWAYYHTGLRFNPPPEGILDVCRRWLSYNLYTLAIVPSPRPSQPRFDPVSNTLLIPVSNDGLIPVAVMARAWLEAPGTGDLDLGQLDLGELGASGVTARWTIPSGPVASAGVTVLRLELVSGGPSRQYSASELTGIWEWDLLPATGTGVDSATVRNIAGPPAGGFLDLGQAFGPHGWYADPERWDADYYHMGRFLRAGETAQTQVP